MLLAAMIFFPAGQISAKGLLGIKSEESTLVGVYIKDLKTGHVIVDHNSGYALTPASVMKSVTVASVLSKYGDNWRWETPVRLSGEVKKNNRAVWCGNLEIVSCADPTIESGNFRSTRGFSDSIIAGLKKAGVRRIEGKVKIIETLSDAGPCLKWEIEDLPWAYGAALYGFNYADNICTIWPATGATSPKAPGLKVDLRKASYNDLVRGIYSDNLVVFAKDPTNKKWSTATTLPSPKEAYEYLLTRQLRKAGIEIADRDAGKAIGSKLIYTHRSPLAKDVMRSLMVRSDNLFAEGMLRRMVPDGSRSECIKAEKDYWKSQGLEADYTYIYDGSGLTRGNRVPPIFIAGVLENMAKGTNSASYVSFFPKAGMDGTMRSFLAKSKLKGKIAMKTGSVAGVQCYAGYKLDNGGKPTHVIVVMVNGFFCTYPQLKASIEKLLEKHFKK